MKATYTQILRTITLSFIALFISSTACIAGTGNNPAENLNLSASEIESEYNIENWMINLNDWSEFAINTEEDIAEENISIENWMLDANDDNWCLLHEVESEKDLEIEEWMLSLSKW